jgi:hypothetical protein
MYLELIRAEIFHAVLCHLLALFTPIGQCVSADTWTNTCKRSKAWPPLPLFEVAGPTRRPQLPKQRWVSDLAHMGYSGHLHMQYGDNKQGIRRRSDYHEQKNVESLHRVPLRRL